jgi:hypothetical protein
VGLSFAILPQTRGMMVEMAGRSMESSVRGCEARDGHVMGGVWFCFWRCRFCERRSGRLLAARTRRRCFYVFYTNHCPRRQAEL